MQHPIMLTFILEQFRDRWQVVRYGLSGMIGALLQIGLLFALVEFFGLWYLYAVVAAFLGALVVTFSLQKFWTFRDYSLVRVHRQSASYAAIALTSLGTNVVCMYVLVTLLGVWYVLAQCAVIGLVGLSSFLLNKIFTFAPQES